MWRKLMIIGIVPILILAVTGCDSGSYTGNLKGNELFAEGQFDAALEAYQSAQVEDPDSPELHYNAGNVLHAQEAYSEAITETLNTLNGADTSLETWTHYNVGNSQFRQEQYEEAIEQYKTALRINAGDQDAKLNLEIAQQRLEQQQQEQQENQSCDNPQQSEDQQDQEQQDQEQQDQEQQDQEQQDQEQQDQEQQDQEQQDQEQQDQEQQDQEQQDQEQQDQKQQDQKQQDQEQQDQEQQDQEQQNQDQQGTPTPTPQSEGEPQPGEGEGTPTPTPEGTPMPVGLGGAELEGMTEEQAMQLLEALAQEDETLHEYLLKLQPKQRDPNAKDW